MRLSRYLWLLFAGVLLAIGVQALFVFHAPEPEDLPWTPLDLRAPIGRFTSVKLANLAHQPRNCHALLSRAEVGFTPLPARHDPDGCGWDDAVRLTGRARPHLTLSCPLAASMDLWMRRVVQPAAVDLLGSRVILVEDLGSYACRPIRGSGGTLSEHAFANAIDVAGFRLADGRRISVSRDWRNGQRGAFLHAVRDGACRLFATTLSPDYNPAHRSHLHLDQAARGQLGWRACS